MSEETDGIGFEDDMRHRMRVLFEAGAKAAAELHIINWTDIRTGIKALEIESNRRAYPLRALPEFDAFFDACMYIRLAMRLSLLSERAMLISLADKKIEDAKIIEPGVLSIYRKLKKDVEEIDEGIDTFKVLMREKPIMFKSDKDLIEYLNQTGRDEGDSCVLTCLSKKGLIKKEITFYEYEIED